LRIVVASLAPASLHLLGTSSKDAGLFDQWVAFVDHEVGSKLYMLVATLMGRRHYSKPIDDVLRSRVIKAIETLNEHLLESTFLLPTERLSLADISFAVVAQKAFETILDPELRARLHGVARLYETIASQPAIKPIFGEFQYAETALQYEKDDDDDEPLIPAEPKTKNPLDDLPKSKFNLEDWERAYSNMVTRGDAGSLKWFCEK
jgi:elongation factor 1-gamma